MWVRRLTNICALCECKLGRFEIHHWNYLCLGKETLHDVSVLCPECHADAHRVMCGQPPEIDDSEIGVYASFWDGSEDLVYFKDEFVDRVNFLMLMGEK